MYKRTKSSLPVLVILVAAFVLSGTQSARVASAKPATGFDLLSALPASDFIVYVDTQRVLTDVVPAVMVGQSEMLAKVESHIEKFRKQVGFDPRSVDGIAVGLNFDSQNARGATFAVIARGRFDANAAIDSGLSAAIKESRGELTKRTEVYEGRTVHLLVHARQAGAERSATTDSESSPTDQTMAFAALDSNTVAFGNLKSVRATIDAGLGRGRVDTELVQLATRSANSVACFSGKLPPDMTRLLRFIDKEGENSIASLKQVYGSFNVTGSDAEGLVNIRMEAEQDARRVSMALNGLKLMAKIGAPHMQGEAKSIEALINSVEVYPVGNEVQITARVALADFSPFVPHR